MINMTIVKITFYLPVKNDVNPRKMLAFLLSTH